MTAPWWTTHAARVALDRHATGRSLDADLWATLRGAGVA